MGTSWVRTPYILVEDEPVTPLAAFVGLADCANGMNVRLRPQEWAFPNIDLTIHMYRTPHGGPAAGSASIRW